MAQPVERSTVPGSSKNVDLHRSRDVSKKVVRCKDVERVEPRKLVPAQRFCAKRPAVDVKNERWRCGYFSVDPSLAKVIDDSESARGGSPGRRR